MPDTRYPRSGDLCMSRTFNMLPWFSKPFQTFDTCFWRLALEICPRRSLHVFGVPCVSPTLDVSVECLTISKRYFPGLRHICPIFDAYSRDSAFGACLRVSTFCLDFRRMFKRSTHLPSFRNMLPSLAARFQRSVLVSDPRWLFHGFRKQCTDFRNCVFPDACYIFVVLA